MIIGLFIFAKEVKYLPTNSIIIIDIQILIGPTVGQVLINK